MSVSGQKETVKGKLNYPLDRPVERSITCKKI